MSRAEDSPRREWNESTGFVFTPFPLSPHLFLLPSSCEWLKSSVHTPGSYTRWMVARCVLPVEAGFLLFVSGVSNKGISKDSTVPCACPVCGEWSTKERWLLWQWDASAQKNIPKTNPHHARTHICQRTLSRTEVWLHNGIQALISDALHCRQIWISEFWITYSCATGETRYVHRGNFLTS